MKMHEQIDIRILIDRLRLLKDSAKQLNKRYSQWTDLENAQIAYPMITYCCELIEILDKEEVRNGYNESTEAV